jgi:deoxyadenosine/deoxycytidine kinase
MATHIFSVEGNIGAGKTTFLERLGQVWPEATIVFEPVGTWMTIKEKDGTSLLDHFYADKKRWSYTFQTAAFLTRILDTERVLETKAASESGPRIVITERSVLTDRHVFAEMLHRNGDMTDMEHDLYLRWYDRYASKMPIRGILYLTTTPAVSLERIETRGREAEAGIPRAYLDDLDSQHRLWLSLKRRFLSIVCLRTTHLM